MEIKRDPQKQRKEERDGKSKRGKRDFFSTKYNLIKHKMEIINTQNYKMHKK